MSGVAWTLEYAGQRRPLRSWGIRWPQLTFQDLDVDEMTFAIARSSVLAEPTFPADADLVLWRNDVRWFSGRVLRPAANGSSRTEVDTYRVVGPWHRLGRVTYQQKWCVNGVQVFTPRVCLGQNQWGQVITIGAQIREILNYAIGKGVTVANGTLPVFLKAWIDEDRDLTCVGAIHRVLRHVPDQVGWMSYATAVPVFNVAKHEDLAAVTLDATAGDQLFDFSGLAPRHDMVPSGVTFIYQSSEVDEESGRTKTTLTTDSAGVSGGEGAIVALIELAQKGQDAFETPPAGLAAAYFNALQTAKYEGTIRILEEECTGALRPGKVVNISNGRAGWAAMRAVVQVVTEDLATGETTAKLGAPGHLGPQHFVQQQQIARRRHQPTAFPRVQPCQVSPTPADDVLEPEEPVDLVANPNAGIDPDSLKTEDALNDVDVTGLSQSVVIPYCDNGVQTCARVVGVNQDCPA